MGHNLLDVAESLGAEIIIDDIEDKNHQTYNSDIIKKIVSYQARAKLLKNVSLKTKSLRCVP